MYRPYRRYPCPAPVKFDLDSYLKHEDACTKFEPFQRIQQKCVLKFPDRKNFNEFFRICPTHGKLSNSELPKEQPCNHACLNHCPPPDNDYPCFYWDGIPLALDSVGQYLEHIHKHGYPYPPYPKALPGSPGDKFENRIKALEGHTLSCRPKGPVAVETHTLRAKYPEHCRRPKTPIEDIVHAHIYEYAKAMGIEDEVPRVFLSELRHVYPKGFVHRPVIKDVIIYRKPKAIVDLAIKAFPGNKFFVRTIKYSDFYNSPDLHFGDQIMEIDPRWLEDKKMPTGDAKDLDMFTMKIMPSPYVRRLKLRVHECAIINEYDVPVKTLENMRSHRDLGFTIHLGRITAVDHHSPAKESGFKPNYHIIEVDGVSVLNFTDEQMVRMMRNRINKHMRREVDVTVIPERVFDTLTDKRVGKHYNVISNAGFNIAFWTEAMISGVW